MGDSELFAQATLDSLSAHIAIVDESGTKVAVNRAWREFARANGATGNVSEGANYLAMCDSATGAGAEYAAAFAEGVRTALAGRREELPRIFERFYRGEASSEKRGSGCRSPAPSPKRTADA